jgi:hypothetical protein
MTSVGEMQNLEDIEIDKEFECSICQDLLVAPVTLLCQHTFCRLCIKSYVDQQLKPKTDEDGYQVYVSRKDKNAKCPLCRCPIVIPPNDNFMLKGLIESKYPEQYNSRVEQYNKDKLKLNLRDQIEDEIRNEIFNGVVDDAVHENNGDGGGRAITDRLIDNGSPYVNITSNHWITKVFSSKSSFTIAWGAVLLALVATMIKLGVNIKTYLGVCMIMWGVYVYLINQF